MPPLCEFHTEKLLGLRCYNHPMFGCGVMATRPFKKGDLIVPYLGEITKHLVPSPYISEKKAHDQYIDAA